MTTKFCRDCVHFTADLTENDGACRSPNNVTHIDIVSGRPQYKLTSARAQRSNYYDNICTPDGRWFEQRACPKSWWDRWFLGIDG